jgi:hypothetical protein
MLRIKVLFFVCAATLFSCASGGNDISPSSKLPGNVTLTTEQLKDKIKGGWAGQTIGVTYGGPTEFKYNGTFIQNYQPIPWYDGYIKKTMIEFPGLYDDIYMDLTFVDVFERLGFDAHVDSFAYAFAHADYKLWHANQAARYNILNGMQAPKTGHWLNSPHSDDIDYQIEADFAGLMNPGMPNSASAISDKIGHIMNYGDGWYGGVYVGAMYTLAFVSDDINFIVKEALKTIPKESRYYKVMADVIEWHKKYPDDWHQTWFELQKKWSDDLHCPDGVFAAFNIDATINSAYVIMGLLYGNGDYSKTLDIATRVGQDSDCNPSTAGGILGAMLGYNKIPAYWKMGLKEAEDLDFKYTSMSLNKVYEIGYRHALEMIKRNGGEVTDKNVTIKVQQPEAVRFEQSYENLYPVANLEIDYNEKGEIEFEFEGTGFVLRGKAEKKNNLPDKSLEATLYIDGEEIETAKLPTDFTTRRLELFWKYQLPNKKHSIRVVVKKEVPGYRLKVSNCIIYSDKPAEDQLHK